MSKAVALRGTQLQRGDAHFPPNYETIAEVRKIEIAGSRATLADVSNHSGADSFREFLGTLVDGGECRFSCNFVPGDFTQQDIEKDFDALQLSRYRVLLPNSLGTLRFDAFVRARDLTMPVAGPAKRNVRLKITGRATGRIVQAATLLETDGLSGVINFPPGYSSRSGNIGVAFYRCDFANGFVNPTLTDAAPNDWQPLHLGNDANGSYGCWWCEIKETPRLTFTPAGLFVFQLNAYLLEIAGVDGNPNFGWLSGPEPQTLEGSLSGDAPIRITPFPNSSSKLSQCALLVFFRGPLKVFAMAFPDVPGEFSQSAVNDPWAEVAGMYDNGEPTSYFNGGPLFWGEGSADFLD